VLFLITGHVLAWRSEDIVVVSLIGRYLKKVNNELYCEPLGGLEAESLPRINSG